MNRRARFWKATMAGSSTPAPGFESGARFRKRHPLDCGKPRCQLCHREKVFGTASHRDRKAAVAAQHDIREASE
jgi:hypothetical protein